MAKRELGVFLATCRRSVGGAEPLGTGPPDRRPGYQHTDRGGCRRSDDRGSGNEDRRAKLCRWAILAQCAIR